MHPEILRLLSAQRSREMRARAGQARLVRMAVRNRRHERGLADEGGEFVLPAIPDYVDGSFRSERAGHEAGRAPAAHRAA